MSFLASRSRSVPEGIGKPVRRREDARLITGAGCYTDDVNLPGQAYASMVRSPHAHAHIVRVDMENPLARGRYHIGCSLLSGSGALQVVALVNRHVSFVVFGGRVYGLVDLEHELHVEGLRRA